MTNKNKIGKMQLLPPVILLPYFRCLPDFVVGIPVVLAIFCFAFVTPNARFALKDTPGMWFFLLAILKVSFLKNLFFCIIVIQLF